jgi:hypothetical protein
MPKSISNDYMTEKFDIAAAGERIARRIAERAYDASDQADDDARRATTFDVDTMYDALASARRAAELWSDYVENLSVAIRECEAGEKEFQELNACPCGDWKYRDHDCSDN